MLIRASREMLAEDAQLAGHHFCVYFAEPYYL